MASERSNEKSDGIAEATQEIDGSMQVMEELLKHSGADILELLLRKLSTASLNLSRWTAALLSLILLMNCEVRDDSSAETSLFVKKGWGRLVSDLIEAQWLCVEFLLEESQGYSDNRGRELGDRLEPFLEGLPDAALEALSLGSGLAVLPVIKCVRLLTPRMLLTDESLCSQALESVWWTFQDRQKGDHAWFWGTLKEMAQVFFNPCLLVLSEDHPVTAIVRKYWGELLALGEDRPGILNHVIEPCCKFLGQPKPFKSSCSNQ
ncbi:Tar (HIV-1) RNA binding protein 1 [Desmophyllum pertusum]|uniref:Tar (HIV-1) RNA binding protein 1 n=1 Tax=Desmophyllum pertusum TaxID=174260 RepID=A0A9X0A655_9CNID|nr:Tar (HIV-1) RNA binding protein 1 [Desmophyllum pertusum]